MHTHPSSRLGGAAQATVVVHRAHGASTIKREGQHTAHVGGSASHGAARVPAGSKDARVAPGSGSWPDWTYNRHHEGHVASTEKHGTCQQRPGHHSHMHGRMCVLTWCAVVGAAVAVVDCRSVPLPSARTDIPSPSPTCSRFQLQRQPPQHPFHTGVPVRMGSAYGFGRLTRDQRGSSDARWGWIKFQGHVLPGRWGRHTGVCGGEGG